MGVDVPATQKGPSLVERAREAITRAHGFLRDELWDADLEPKSWAGRGLWALQFTAMVAQGFVRDQLTLRAMALTYFTVLSLIPMVAIAISIATAVGVTANLAQIVVEKIAAGSPESQQQILDLINNANFAGLGSLGAAVLFFTTILGISNIERSLNHLWGVKQQRSLGRRFTDYLAVLVVAPLLLGSALSLATTLKSQALVDKLLVLPGFELLYNIGLTQMATVVMGLAFGFLYWFLPNTTVRAFPAFLGGFVAAVLVDAAQTLYLNFSVGAAKANAFFGGFAQLPLLFVWIYFFWAIVLFGAEVAFAYQTLPHYRRQVRGREAGSAEREAVGLRIALEVGRAFRDGAPPWDGDALSDALGVPVRTVRDVVSKLQAAGIVSSVGPEQREDGFQLGRPAERIAVTDVIASLRGRREPVGGDPDVAGPVESVLAELRQGEAKAAGGHTLGDLLAGIPARPATP